MLLQPHAQQEWDCQFSSRLESVGDLGKWKRVLHLYKLGDEVRPFVSEEKIGQTRCWVRPAAGQEHRWLFCPLPQELHTHSASLTAVSEGNVQKEVGPWLWGRNT